MGQRLGIAAALLGDPQVVMLDEPVNGLDPEGIRWIRDLLKGLAAEGRTVFLSSHLMSEMSLTADHLIVIGRGRKIADASAEEFVRRHRGTSSGSLAAGRRARRARRGAPASTVELHRAGLIEVEGLTAEQIGTEAAAQGNRAVRAHPAAGHARGRIHGADPGRGRVQDARRRTTMNEEVPA